jgi:hypothetical protein
LVTSSKVEALICRMPGDVGLNVRIAMGCPSL